MLTSYVLLRLVDTNVEVGIGAVRVGEVLSIVPRCGVAALVREPSEPSFRIRFCGMTLTDNGLVPEPSHTSEQHGAWLRVLTITQRITAALGTLILSEGDSIDDCWAWPTGSTSPRKVCLDDRIQMLDEPTGKPGDVILLVRGPRVAIDKLLAAIAQEVKFGNHYKPTFFENHSRM
jgi:hypothetical protein